MSIKLFCDFCGSSGDKRVVSSFVERFIVTDDKILQGKIRKDICDNCFKKFLEFCKKNEQ